MTLTPVVFSKSESDGPARLPISEVCYGLAVLRTIARLNPKPEAEIASQQFQPFGFGRGVFVSFPKQGIGHCPKCRAKMAVRTASKGKHKGEKFFGCTRYPVCKGTRPYRDSWVPIAELPPVSLRGGEKTIRCNACGWSDQVDPSQAGYHILAHRNRCTEDRLKPSDRPHRSPKAKRITRLGKAAPRSRFCPTCREPLTSAHDTLMCPNGCTGSAQA